MKGLTFEGPQDLLALLVRRRWWVIFPFLALSGVITVLTFILPKTYVSETLIMIRPRDVPNDFVKDLISGSTEQRLSAIKQTVLSRSNLLQILSEFEANLVDFQGLNTDQKIRLMGDRIIVNFDYEKITGVQLPLTYFRISYQDRNPELAMKIANKLTAYFIELDSRARETQVFGTTEFLSAELDKVSTQLKASEATLREFKSRRLYELPNQLETNLRTLDRLNLQKQSNAEALDRYATLRLNIERQLSETPEFVARPLAAAVGQSDSPLQQLISDYLKKLQEYEQLSLKYKPLHPEVRVAKTELDKLKQQIPAAELAALEKSRTASVAPGAGEDGKPVNETMVPNPAHKNLVSQLGDVKHEFELRDRERLHIESELAKYSQRVENTPYSEQEVAEVVRVNADLQKQYDDLKGHLDQARLSESLESRAKGSQFVVVDPANFPLTPTKPSKIRLLLAGNALALVIAIVFAAGIDVARQKMWTQSEINKLWGFPVLIEIPEIITDYDVVVAKKKRLGFVATSAVASVAYAFLLYQVYLRQGFVLKVLDPLIQRLVY